MNTNFSTATDTKKVGEYLMFFQNNTRSKFTTASAKSSVTQRVAIAVSKRSALHSRLWVLDFYLSKIPPFQNNILKDYFFTTLVDFGVQFSINQFLFSSTFLGFREGLERHVLFG